eukprot:6231802-Amphidinium_carterae.1
MFFGGEGEGFKNAPLCNKNNLGVSPSVLIILSSLLQCTRCVESTIALRLPSSSSTEAGGYWFSPAGKRERELH